MKRYITDNTGKSIEVTDVEAGIKQAKLFSGYENENHPLTIYWKDILSKLISLKDEIAKEPPIEAIADPISDPIPQWVRNIRNERLNNHPEHYLKLKQKLFVKNGNHTTKIDTTLYGIHSCVRAGHNVTKLERMAIGETWDRGFGSPSITRIF